MQMEYRTTLREDYKRSGNLVSVDPRLLNLIGRNIK
jgi:hypothetical protein